MSTFALGQTQVRRSGYGAMQLAGPYAFGPPPDRTTAIGVLRAAVAAGHQPHPSARHGTAGRPPRQAPRARLRLRHHGQLGKGVHGRVTGGVA